MTTKLERVRRALYFSQRTIGDAQALQRGPGHYVRRVARRTVTRSLFRLFKG
jgi:hypothetical protein